MGMQTQTLEKILNVIKDSEHKKRSWKSLDKPLRHYLMSFSYLIFSLFVSYMVWEMSGRSSSSMILTPISVLLVTGIIYCVFSLLYLLYDLLKAIKNLDPDINRAQNEDPIVKKQLQVLSALHQKELKLFSKWISYKIQAENKQAILIGAVGGSLSFLGPWLLSVNAELMLADANPVKLILTDSAMSGVVSFASATMISVAFIIQSLTIRWARYKFYVEACID